MTDDALGQAPRRTPRQGAGGAPVGSALSVVLAVIAVVAGFLILRNITSDDEVTGGAPTDPVEQAGGSGSADGDNPGEGSVDPVETSTTVAPTTTIGRVTDGAAVVVANANGVPGSAGGMTQSLEFAGYTMGEATNASGADVDDSIVYYDATVAAAQDVANSVARDLGGVLVETIPVPPPTESGTLEGGASVLVLLGNNEAGKTLEELAPAAGTAAAPDVSGTETDPAADPATDPATATTVAAGDG